MDHLSNESFMEEPVYRSVSSGFEPTHERDFEFGSGEKFIQPGLSSSSLHMHGLTKPEFPSSSHAHAYRPEPLSLSDRSPASHCRVVDPPVLFDAYYEQYTSFLSRTPPTELMSSLQDVLQRLGCECRPLPSEARIEATQFVDYTRISFDANLFTKDPDSDLYLVEINRRSGDCMKFSSIYSQVMSTIMSAHPEIVEPSAADEASSSSLYSSSTCVSSHDSIPTRSDEPVLDSSDIPARPGLRRSPSSTGSCGGVTEPSLAPFDPHPFGPTKLSRDLLDSLLAFCRSEYFEQQRQGLELLARISAEPANRTQLVDFGSELLAAVADILPSHDCGIQHSACAVLSHVLSAARGDTKTLFPETSSPSSSPSSVSGSHSRSAPVHARESNECPLARSIFSNVSSLLYEQSCHVRQAASNVLNYVATESAEPELAKSPIYLTWLQEQLSLPDIRVGKQARSILQRLGSL